MTGQLRSRLKSAPWTWQPEGRWALGKSAEWGAGDGSQGPGPMSSPEFQLPGCQQQGPFASQELRAAGTTPREGPRQHLDFSADKRRRGSLPLEIGLSFRRPVLHYLIATWFLFNSHICNPKNKQTTYVLCIKFKKFKLLVLEAK